MGKAALLTLSGHDPTGGAGIDADRSIFRHFGFRALSVPTALTVQNLDGVRRVDAPPEGLIEEAVEALLDEYTIPGVKIGLLTSESLPSVVRAVRLLCAPPPLPVQDPQPNVSLGRGEGLRLAAVEEAPLLDHPKQRRPHADVPDFCHGPVVVLDPVLAAGTGRDLDPDGELRLGMLRELLRWVSVVIPNPLELARLVGYAPRLDPPVIWGVFAGRRLLLQTGGRLRAVLVKSLSDPQSETGRSHLLISRDAKSWNHEFDRHWPETCRRVMWPCAPRKNERLVHGTGCRFASALLALIFRGHALPVAARMADELVTGLCNGPLRKNGWPAKQDYIADPSGTLM